MTNKPFAAAADQNKEDILKVLQQELSKSKSLLEIGSGTGQHAVYMAPLMPHLSWQPSDVAENLSTIALWIHDAPANNLLPEIELDVCADWPTQTYDAIFTCNTFHILSEKQIDCLLKGSASLLRKNGKLCAYGPFNLNGAYTSISNQQFDQWLKQQNDKSGIKDLELLNEIALDYGLKHCSKHTMPANNFIMVWSAG